MSSTHHYFDTVRSFPADIRDHIQNKDYKVIFEGESNGVYYKNEFALTDLEFKFADEITDPIDTADVFTLDKPLCIIYVQPMTRGHIRGINGWLNVEFQIVVNTEPQGLLNLDGYSNLMRSICDPRRNLAFWNSVGLAPRFVNEGKTLKGGEVLERFEGRLFLRSLIIRFDILGENVYG